MESLIAGSDAVQGVASVDDNHDRVDADEISDYPWLDQDVPAREDQHVAAIFLSHSGKQKPFVENLYNALRRANHTVFFDKHSLPKGSPFPAHINQAARGCKLGVVVLSDDFLQSKWPMLELQLLLRKRAPHAKVLPLFYMLSPKDLKSPENLSKWQQAWKKKAPKLANEWKKVVEALDSFNGVEFNPGPLGASEDAYIQKVVRVICKVLPSSTSYDLSPIKGQERLVKVVGRLFRKVCMVGLHGVGGLGKTTVCKIMVNFYNSQYLGKSCHIEFPSDGDDKMIVQECKKALRTFANLSDEHVLNEAHDFEQVVHLMRENLSRYDVFFAIDNVCESSRERAQRILGVGFNANSKILVTSRSEQVLKELLEGHSKKTHVCPLPSPDHEEAFEIFQESLSQYSDSLVNRDQFDPVLKRCFFSGSYHALALKALGQYVKRACEPEGLDNIAHRLPSILEEVSNKDGLEWVEDLLMLNYVNLPEHKQRMFLDIVAVVMKMAAPGDPCNVKVTFATAYRWLDILYKEYSDNRIHNLIYELSLDGLIQLEKYNGHTEAIITVHDLYSDLAQREATRSSRFFIADDGYRSTKLVDKIEWKQLERVILTRKDCVNAHFIEKLQQQECQKLQVLCGFEIYFRSEIDISLMPSLCILKFVKGTLKSIKNWRAARELAIVHLDSLECAQPLKLFSSVIPCLQELIIKNVKKVKGPPNLNGCQHLKTLALAEASVWINKSQKYSEDYFNSLTNLESLQIQQYSSITRVLNINALVSLQLLHIESCHSVQRIEGLAALKKLEQVYISNVELKKLPDLSRLTCLERLVLQDNGSMEEVEGLNPALKVVEIGNCGALKKVPDLSHLTRLKSLVLCHNGSMEEVGGLSSPALKVVDIRDCGALKKVPDLSRLTCLEKLVLLRNESMEEVGGLSGPALKVVDIRDCGALKKVSDLSRLTCLKMLWLHRNESMEEVGGLSSPALKDVDIRDCGALKKVPDLSHLTCLETLVLYRNESMEEVGGLNSPALKDVDIRDCGALKKVPDLSRLTSLESLCLYRNESMEEVGGLSSPALKVVDIKDCGALKKVPDLSRLTCLERLALCHNESMEEVGGLSSPALKVLDIRDCGALKKVPDLSHLTCLERLVLYRNESMEEVGGLSSPALKEVDIWDCGALKKVPDLSRLTCLERLVLYGNEAMEEVGGLSSPALKVVDIQDCGALKKVPDLSHLTCLERLVLRRNKSMEEVGGLSPALKGVYIRNCGAVKNVPPDLKTQLWRLCLKCIKSGRSN